MKIKVSELNDMALDWVVTGLEEPEALRYGVADWREQRRLPRARGEYPFRYHQNWNQGGPIIEREKIEFRYDRTGRWANAWIASTLERMLGGPTPLIAAMRCFVASKHGDEIDIPEELLK